MGKVKYLYIFFLGIFSFFLLSCSEPTIEEDARKAADLTMESNEYTRDNDFSSAGKKYAEVQEIMDKYKKMNKFDEFYQIYISIMQDDSYRMEESAASEGNTSTTE